MARVVLVHGIAQEQSGPAALECSWLPALADGIRAAGNSVLADELWPDRRPRAIDVRMGFYGNLYIDPDAMGTKTDIGQLDDGQVALATDLAREWLLHAQQRPDHPDHETATSELDRLNYSGEAMGARQEAARVALRAVTKVRWFAVGGMALAGRFVNKSLIQVTRYLTEPKLHEQIQARVLALIDEDTQVIVGHSLGSVVAYELAATCLDRQLPLLVTLGSPLGLRSVIYDRVKPQPATFPERVTTWVNVADRNDLVAAEPDLQGLFPGRRPGQTFLSGWTVDNGTRPHEAQRYLSKRLVGQQIARVLS